MVVVGVYCILHFSLISHHWINSNSWDWPYLLESPVEPKYKDRQAHPNHPGTAIDTKCYLLGLGKVSIWRRRKWYFYGGRTGPIGPILLDLPFLPDWKLPLSIYRNFTSLFINFVYLSLFVFYVSLQ